MNDLTKFQTPNKALVIPATRMLSTDIEAAYDSYEASYSMVGDKYWSEERFRRKIKGWVFFGSAEGYVAARKQRSGGLKLTLIAGDPNSPNHNKSLKRALSLVMAQGLPTWALVSKRIAKISQRAGFMILSSDEVDALFREGPLGEDPIIPSFTVVDGRSSYRVTNRGTLIVKDPELGTNEKFVIVNDDWIEHSIDLIKERMAYDDSDFLYNALTLLGKRIGKAIDYDRKLLPS